MSKLKPSSFDVYPIYKCDCGSEWNEEIKFTQKIGKILCGCGKVLVIEPIEFIDCIPQYKQSHPNKQQIVSPKNSENKKKNSREIKLATEVLTTLGWKSKKARPLVNELSNSYSGDWEDFSEYVIREAHAK